MLPIAGIPENPTAKWYPLQRVNVTDKTSGELFVSLDGIARVPEMVKMNRDFQELCNFLGYQDKVPNGDREIFVPGELEQVELYVPDVIVSMNGILYEGEQRTSISTYYLHTI